MGSYQSIDHTADIGFKVEADNLEDHTLGQLINVSTLPGIRARTSRTARTV